MTKLIIPMAGEGSRFKAAGFVPPKPFIEVIPGTGVSMIELVLKNLSADKFSEVVLLVRREHLEWFGPLLGKLDLKNLSLVIIDKLTEGAACTLLHAYEHLNTDEGIVIANSDQWIKWDWQSLPTIIQNCSMDHGAIITFKDTTRNPKWSYASVINTTGRVTGVAEKKPISDYATVGIYYFHNGKKLIRSAVSMIAQNIRTNNEFYICPIYNEYLKKNPLVRAWDVRSDEMYGLGTPEDLEAFRKWADGKTII